MGASNAGGVGTRQKSRFRAYTWLTACALSTLRPVTCYQYGAPHYGPASWHLSLVVSGGDCWWRETTTKFNVTPKTTEQHLIARSDKSVAYVTNNNTARRFVQLILTTDGHEAARGLFATAELLISPDYRDFNPHYSLCLDIAPVITTNTPGTITLCLLFT